MTSKIVLVAMGIVGLSAMVAYGALSNKDANLIRIAFQNGFVAALRLNLEQIQKLQSDNDTLQKMVEDAAERYVKRVQELNK